MNAEGLKQEARISLLQYYSSKCTAHGTNILTIAIGFFAFVQVLDYLPHLDMILIVVMPIFGAILVHQIIRFLVWACLTGIVILVPFPHEF